MLALDAAQIIADAGFERRIDGLAEIVPQQNIFGGNGGVGFELEQPMAVGALAGEQRVARRVDMPVEIELSAFASVCNSLTSLMLTLARLRLHSRRKYR